MRRVLFFISVIVAFATSCTKSIEESAMSNADVLTFQGKYVKKEARQDTIVISITNNRNTLFNNTAAFRENLYMQSHPELQTFEYEFRDGKIGVRLFAEVSPYVYYDFQWLEPGKVFKIQAVAIQSDVSNTNLYYTYERVQ